MGGGCSGTIMATMVVYFRNKKNGVIYVRSRSCLKKVPFQLVQLLANHKTTPTNKVPHAFASTIFVFCSLSDSFLLGD